MRIKHFILAGALCLLVPSLAGAAVEYSYAQISTANSTVDLIPTTSVAATLNAVKCIFPSNDGGAAVKITVYFGVGQPFQQVSSFTVDPTYFERESNGAGQYLSGWIPFGIGDSDTLHVTLNNTGLGTATINCWASWLQ
jgi:hypothetical protein